jgi:hypothetical protein
MGKDLSELASYMMPLASKLLGLAVAAGLDPVVEDTGRTQAEQAIKISQNVSWTSHSKHLPQPPEMKSEAIDIVPRALLALKYWGWNGRYDNSDPRWLQLCELGEGLGLECGGRWTHVPADPGHFQFVHQPAVTTT